MPYPGDKLVSLTLPSVVSSFGNGINTIVATTWSVLPTFPADATITNPSATFNLLVQVSYGAWFTSGTNPIRACIVASGGVTITPGVGAGGALGWGEILYHGGGLTTLNHYASYNVVIPAGAASVVFAWNAYLDTGGGTETLNYPVTRITPLYFL